MFRMGEATVQTCYTRGTGSTGAAMLFKALSAAVYGIDAHIIDV